MSEADKLVFDLLRNCLHNVLPLLEDMNSDVYFVSMKQGEQVYHLELKKKIG